MKPKMIIVAGPTAVGKTEYAIDLAKKCDGEIVSLDSVQVYKGLDIGSAKPSREEQATVKHYMIDEVEPDVNINVKEFKELAEKHIDDIINNGKLPILVGGSGFYINAILYGTNFLEEDERDVLSIQSDLEEIFKKNGKEFLHEMLKQVDPESADKIPQNNVRRAIRALTFYKIHGMPISKHNQIEKERVSKYDYTFYVLNMDRNKLYTRINVRVDNMIKKGLLVEVKSLINKGLSKNLNSMNSIGYKELYDFCSSRDNVSDISKFDEVSKKELKDIIEQIKMHSRNYAKRQLTWFKAQRDAIWISR